MGRLKKLAEKKRLIPKIIKQTSQPVEQTSQSVEQTSTRTVGNNRTYDPIRDSFT